MKRYDVIIIGGGTAGCSCAWNCARHGLKTLLIEKEKYLGGTMTGSLVIPVMKSGDNQINTDFYSELITKMRENNGQITYQNNPGWFNPFILKNVLYNMLIDANADIMLSSYINTIDTNNNYVNSIKILSEYIDANYYVDATGNLSFSKKINCQFLPQTDSPQPMSLRFIMNNIDLNAFGDWLMQIDTDSEVTSVEIIDGKTHLSTAYTWDSSKNWALAPYFDKAVEEKVLKDADRNYFQVFTVAGFDGALAFNCPRIISTCNEDEAYKLGVEAIYRISNFCKNYFPGFKKAEIFKIADRIGIRSSLQIKGKYIYTIDDLRSGKKFRHPAVISNYPVDVHSGNKNTSTLEHNGEYQLPIESLMSADYENLFIVGRGLSADKLSQGALRVQASCFSMGEAVAKYISAISS